MITLADGRELWHTPNPDPPATALQRLSDFWSSAVMDLFIVDYSFNLPLFASLLPDLKAKGVNVQLVLDRSQSSGATEKPLIAKLQAAGIDMVIGTSCMHQIVHDKFSIVDQCHAEYGSFNFTQAAGEEDNFFFIELASPIAVDLLDIGHTIREWIVQNEPQV